MVSRALLMLTLVLAPDAKPAPAAPANAPSAPAQSAAPPTNVPPTNAVANWPGDEMPLPLVVKTPEDLSFKLEVERQYAVFNLMTAGKIAYEAGDYARAARKWEALLKLPNLPAEIPRVVQPLLEDAQQAAAGGVSVVGAASASRTIPATSPTTGGADIVRAVPRAYAPEIGNVTGTVSGGGVVGPGGAVVWLKRLDGPTPAVKPLRKTKIVSQKDKIFIPRVLAVPVGSTVDFRNDDPYYHNVFSLSPPQKFDTGLYASGLSYTQTFDRPGTVELLCNIHSSMVGYVVAVDTPYYTQPRGNGTFVIRQVPPGRYELSAWHEASMEVLRQPLQVRESGASGVLVKIPNDRAPSVVVPDKYGKPRQPQLGY
jgi:plastocyanin